MKRKNRGEEVRQKDEKRQNDSKFAARNLNRV